MSGLIAKSGWISYWKKLNTRLVLTPKLIYFAIGAVYYTFYVYRMAFFRRYLRLGEDGAGIVQAVWNAASIIGVTGWSNAGDVLGAHRGLLVGLCLAMAGTFELILLRDLLAPALWIYLAVIVFGLFGFLSAGVMPLTDFQVLRLLRDVFGVDDTLYGQQVLFGTVAYGLITYGLGELIEGYTINILFWVMPIVSVLGATLVWMFGISGPKRRVEGAAAAVAVAVGKHQDAGPSDISLTTYARTLGQPRFLLVLAVILSIGIGRQVLTIFLPTYLEQELSLSERKIGQTYLGSSLSSIIFLALGPYLLRRLGVRMMLLVGLGALTLRLGAYAIMQPGPTCLYKVMAIESLNGISFSFTHLGGVREAAACAPQGWETVFQAVYTAAYTQIPAIFVSLVGGYLYKGYGGHAFLTGTAILSLCSFILFFLVFLTSAVLSHPRPLTAGYKHEQDVIKLPG